MKTSRSNSSLHILTLVSLLISLIGGMVNVTPAHAAATFTVNSPADVVDAAPGNGVCETAPGNGVCTLRAAIQEANAWPGDDTITVPSGTYTLTIPGRGEYLAATGDLDITSSITINGAGAGSTIIEAGTLGVGGPPDGIDRVFRVDGVFTVNISGVTVRNGNVSSGNLGGGISNYLATLTITNSAFSGNSATLAPVGGSGGGISNNGTLIVMNSTFSGNSASISGGGIFNMGTLTITNSTFSGNIANLWIDGSGLGGGIYNNSGTATITNSAFASNHATNSGGGIFIGAGAVTITNSTFSGNSASNSGGGGIDNVGTLTITNSTFSANSALSGGSIDNVGALTITNSTFSGNSAQLGGDIINYSTLAITNSTFSANSALLGGGIYNIAGTVTLLNTIVANSTSGGNCSGTITADSYNLDTDGTCDNATQKTTAQINLGSLADNGGPTQTFALLTGSSAIDAGNDTVCAAAVGSPTYGAGGLDQRGIARPQGLACDIGAYEALDTTPPTVVSVTRVDPDPTSATSVHFTVTFSKAVTGVDATDFSLNKTATIAGESVNTVSGGPMIYTVSVSTGTGSGSLRLDVKTSGTDIQDLMGNPISGGFTGGETYTIQKNQTFYSSGLQDGWVLESTEFSNKGGTIDSTATTLRLGDDNLKRQYRSILSFSTGASLPDTAVITKVTLKVKRQGIIGGGNPVTMFQGFMVDIKEGFFGTAALQTSDFQTAANKTYGPFLTALGGGWYSIDLTSGKAYINKLSTLSGLTQIRLRFSLDDNNNMVANYLSLFSGNAPAASRPQLIIQYYVP
jgi:CSLREA domain-containing protein